MNAAGLLLMAFWPYKLIKDELQRAVRYVREWWQQHGLAMIDGDVICDEFPVLFDGLSAHQQYLMIREIMFEATHVP